MGHILIKDGLGILGENVKTLVDTPPPRDTSQMQFPQTSLFLCKVCVSFCYGDRTTLGRHEARVDMKEKMNNMHLTNSRERGHSILQC